MTVRTLHHDDEIGLPVPSHRSAGRRVARRPGGSAAQPAPDDPTPHAAEAHRRHIDDTFYPCSHAMHRGLADLYLADPR